MTPIKSAHAVPAAERQRIIGTLERTDETKFTCWLDELQSQTRGTHLYALSRSLETADAFALLLHVRRRV